MLCCRSATTEQRPKSRWGHLDTTICKLTQAVKDVMEFGSRYGVPIRLVDVVGERYQRR